jgi:MFS superfamily sulfate permease-like transporter
MHACSHCHTARPAAAVTQHNTVSACARSHKQKVNAKYAPKMPLPGAALVMIVTIIITWAARLDTHYKLKIVGKIPKGLPAGVFPSMTQYSNRLPSGWLLATLGQALIIALVTYVMTIALGKVISERRRYKVGFACL